MNTRMRAQSRVRRRLTGDVTSALHTRCSNASRSNKKGRLQPKLTSRQQGVSIPTTGYHFCVIGTSANAMPGHDNGASAGK